MNEKRYVPVFQCKNCNEKLTDEFNAFSADGEADIRLVLSVRCKNNAPLHRCTCTTYGMTELVGAYEISQ